jgi:DNA-binding GntR family transcriptional regulator
MRIREGQLEPGARIPSRNAIIARYGVGETAAKHALQVLATEGLTEARAGSGTFVRRSAAIRQLEHDREHAPGSPFGIEDAGSIRVNWQHQTEQLVPPTWVAGRLGLQPAEHATVTRYLLTADGEPVQLAVSYEPAALTAGTQVALPEQGQLAGRGVVERMRAIGVLVDHVTEELAVRPALLAEAALLAIAPGAAVLAMHRLHLAGELAVELAEIVIPAGRFRLSYRYPVQGQPA